MVRAAHNGETSAQNDESHVEKCEHQLSTHDIDNGFTIL